MFDDDRWPARRLPRPRHSELPAEYRFSGDIDGYPEGELYFPGSPVLSVHGTFAECVLLETLVLSILNHDTAIASAAARMVSAADGRPLIEMGSRRTHEQAAVAAARAAYIAGFAGISNLEAQRRYGVPALGTSAHAFTLLHTTARRPGRAGRVPRTGRRARRGHHVARRHLRHHRGGGQRRRGRGSRTRRGAHRLRRPRRTGPPGARPTRRARRDRTKIVVSSDLDEFAIAALRPNPSTAMASARAWSPDRARPPQAWSTSWSRSTASRSRSAAATRSPTAAASRRCGWPSGREPSSRRSSTRRASRRPHHVDDRAPSRGTDGPGGRGRRATST